MPLVLQFWRFTAAHFPVFFLDILSAPSFLLEWNHTQNHSCLLLVTRATRCATGTVTAERWSLRHTDVGLKGNKSTACPLRLTWCKILFHRVFLACCKQKADSENQAVDFFIENRVEMCLVLRHTFGVLTEQSKQHLYCALQWTWLLCSLTRWEAWHDWEHTWDRLMFKTSFTVQLSKNLLY